MKEKKIVKIIFSKIFIAFILTLLSVAIGLIFSGGRVFYATNDDYISSLFFSAGYDKSLFYSYFLTFPIFWLQSLFTDLNLNFFMISQFFMSFFAIVVINYVFLKKFGIKIGVLFDVLVDFIYASTVLILMQFTHTATMMCLSGYLCLFVAVFLEEKRVNKFLQTITAVFLVILGSWFRINSFEVVTVVVCIAICCIFLIEAWREKNNKISIKIAIVNSFKKYYKPVVLVLLTAFVTFGINFCSEALKSTDPEYVNFKQYNAVRSATVDYGRAGYEGNEKFYNSIGIYSQNDIDCVGNWYGDYDFFNVDRLTAISNYSAKPEFGMRFSLSYIYSFLREKISAVTGMNPELILFLAVVLVIIAFAVIYKFRNKVKYLFPVLLTLFWIMFFGVFKITESSILMIPICALSVISSFLCNRYRFFMNIAMGACAISLFTYLNFTRISFRATYTFLVSIFIVLLLSVNKNNLRKVFQNKSFKLRKVLIPVICSALTISFVFTELLIWNNIIYKLPAEDRTDCELNEYVKANSDEIFVFDLSLLRVFGENYVNPLKEAYTPENTVELVGWNVGSPYYLEKLNENNIPYMFKDMINNEEASFIFTTRSLVKELNAKDLVQTYYNEHYAEKNESIVLETEKEFDDYAIYKVVTVKQ